MRKLYPNQYVMIRILKSRREGTREFVDEVAIVRNITDPREATNELLRSRGDTLVYHTGSDKIVLEVRIRPGLRGAI